MSDTLSIKVTIAGRTYPLTIQRSEEEKIRKAAAKVNESINKFQENYAVKDKQDLLAMAALQYSTEATSAGAEVELDAYTMRLQAIENQLSEFIDR